MGEMCASISSIDLFQVQPKFSLDTTSGLFSSRWGALGCEIKLVNIAVRCYNCSIAELAPLLDEDEVTFQYLGAVM